MFHAGQHLTFYPKNYFPEDNDEFRSLHGHAVEVVSGPHTVTSQRKPTSAYIVRLSSTSAPDGGDLIVAYEHELQAAHEVFTGLQQLDCQYRDFHLGRAIKAAVNGGVHSGRIITAMRKHAADPIYGIELDNGQLAIMHGTSFLDRMTPVTAGSTITEIELIALNSE